jgi:hypothetical protein
MPLLAVIVIVYHNLHIMWDWQGTLCVFARFNQNFGVLGVLDWLHGTDVIFRQSRAYDRHVYFLNTTPLKELYPDEPAKGCKKN